MKLLLVILFVHTLSPAEPTRHTRWHQTGIATTYHNEHDKGKWRGDTLACLWNKPIKDLPNGVRFCAHRRYPCGTVLHVENLRTKKRTYCVVLDRGPYGAILPNGRWGIKIRSHHPGRWRGVLDLSPGTSRAIGARGWARVRLRRVKLFSWSKLLGKLRLSYLTYLVECAFFSIRERDV